MVITGAWSIDILKRTNSYRTPLQMQMKKADLDCSRPALCSIFSSSSTRGDPFQGFDPAAGIDFLADITFHTCITTVLSDIVSTQGASVRLFKTKWFTRFADKEGIDDAKLIETVKSIENGLIDADYGGGVIKQRIARDGGGKSGGYRSVVAFRSDTRSIFMFAFPKSVQDNLSIVEKREYKKAAAVYLGMTEEQITTAVEAGVLIEVEYVQKIQK